MTAKDLSPVKGLISLGIDATKDAIAAKKSGQPITAELFQFANLVPDVEGLVPLLGELPGSLSGFAPEDAAVLVEFALSKGIVTDQHAQAVINASLQVAQSVWSLILTIEQATPAPAAAAPAPAEPAPSEPKPAEST